MITTLGSNVPINLLILWYIRIYAERVIVTVTYTVHIQSGNRTYILHPIPLLLLPITRHMPHNSESSGDAEYSTPRNLVL